MAKTLLSKKKMEPIKKGTGEEFHYSGYFEWPGTYDFICGWMSKNQLKLCEKVFKDKTSKEGFTEREIGLIGNKKVDRMNQYWMYVDIKMWDCQEVEVTKDGKTQKMSRGRFRVRIKSEINRDYQDLFGRSDFWQKMWGLYEKLTTWDWTIPQWDYWYEKSYELHQKLREYLKTDT